MTEPEPEPTEKEPIKFRQLLPYLLIAAIGLPAAVGLSALAQGPVVAIVLVAWIVLLVVAYRRNRVVGLGLIWGTVAVLVVAGSCVGIVLSVVAQ